VKIRKLFVIALVWPEPNATAAGIRLLQLLDIFKQMNFSICFGATSSFNKSSEALEKMGIEVYCIESNAKSFDDLLRDLHPDMVLFDRFIAEEQFGWRVDELFPDIVKILDTEDLHFLRDTRKNDHPNKNLSIEIKKSELTKREIASILRCDLTLVISVFEFNLLINELKIDRALLHYIPFVPDHLSAEEIGQLPSFEKRKDFMSIGNFLHRPNRDAVKLLHDTLWPEIKKKLPNSNLLIYGAYPDEEIKKLHNQKKGFLIIGQIDDVGNAFKEARVCLAPLRFGAGQKGKLIDSMRYGTPNVTTEIGAESMSDNQLWNGFITNDWEQFVQRSVDLYTDQSNWEKAQKDGFSILEKFFNKKDHTLALIEKIEAIQQNLEQRRIDNFFGAMLKLKNTKSTKYLSKWIEEKNKS
jgi:glycosyltransferase involved in cell wall biosynthesis